MQTLAMRFHVEESPQSSLPSTADAYDHRCVSFGWLQLCTDIG